MKKVLIATMTVVVLACAALVNGAQDVGGIITNRTTRCFFPPLATNYRNWDSTALSAADQGFRWINSNHTYTLILKGLHFKQQIPQTSTFYWWFEPTQFAIKGVAQGRSGGNPPNQALGSQVVFRLHSTKTTVNYSLSIPWAFSMGWENENKVKKLSSRVNWENTATEARSGEMTWANPIRGSAGVSTGLTSITLLSNVIPGADSGSYSTTTNTWSAGPRFRSNARATNIVGLTEINCSAVAWQ